ARAIQVPSETRIIRAAQAIMHPPRADSIGGLPRLDVSRRERTSPEWRVKTARMRYKASSRRFRHMPFNGQPDQDPQETREWRDALGGVLSGEGADRAPFILQRMIDEPHRSGAPLPFSATTDYVNTIPADKQVRFPGDLAIEQRIHAYTRWNAMAMVLRANK